MFRQVISCILVLALGYAAQAAASSIQLNYQVINNFPVKYVTIDMNDPDVVVTTAVARSFPYGLDSWGSFLSRLQPDAAINGTYFCVRGYQPVGDVAIDGSLVYRGCVGSTLGITPGNKVDFLPGPKQGKNDWTGYRTVLGAGPRLLVNGRVDINGRSEGFRDPRVLGSAPRSAIALRSDNVLILLTISKNISLTNLAWVCQKLGAVQAMTLDGGSSSGLYADGRTVTRPTRSISNIIAVYSTQKRYSSFAPLLAPDSPPIISRLLDGTNFAQAAFTFAPASSAGMAVQQAPPPVEVVKILEPAPTKPLQGIVPVKVRVAKEVQLALCTLRINGELCALTNTSALEYRWDSTKVADGRHTLQVSVFSPEKDLLAMESRDVTVKNAKQLAKN